MKPMMFKLLYFTSIIFLCLLLFACASSIRSKDQVDEFYDRYVSLTKMQAAKDPLIGIWQGSKGGKPVILAVIENDENGPEKLKAIILNGGEYQFGYSDGDPWFYASPMAAQGTYAGKVVYRELFWSKWYPTKIVMSNFNSFTAHDDVPPRIKTPGGKTHSYVQKEQIIAVDDIARSSGTGFLIRNTNLIITAHHVVGKAKTIGVRFPDGSIFPAEVVGRDAQNDIAILRLEFFTPSPERGFRLDSDLEIAPVKRSMPLGIRLVKH
jgi:S1-C subfamily serine protease